jgi:hypothetical protein
MVLPTEIALGEFQSVRAEIAMHQQAKTRYLTLALTATGAIGAFALGRNGNIEALLVLPLVLSGLAIVYLKHNLDVENLGEYVRDQLWPLLQSTWGRSKTGDIGELPSWDAWINNRRATTSRKSLYGALGVLPPLLIFSAPSVCAVAIVAPHCDTIALKLALGLDCLVLLISLYLTAWTISSGRSWKLST